MWPDFPRRFLAHVELATTLPTWVTIPSLLPLNIGVADVTSPLDVSYLPVFTLVNNTTRRDCPDNRSRSRPHYWKVGGYRKSERSHPARTCQPRALLSQWFCRDAGRTSLVFYDMRFNIGFTPQEKADLIAFLNSL